MNFTNITPTITVVKTNDANGDTTYSDSESIGEPGGTVPFKVTITNNSTLRLGQRSRRLADAVGVNAADNDRTRLQASRATRTPTTQSFVLAPSETVTLHLHQDGHRQRG